MLNAISCLDIPNAKGIFLNFTFHLFKDKQYEIGIHLVLIHYNCSNTLISYNWTKVMKRFLSRE